MTDSRPAAPEEYESVCSLHGGFNGVHCPLCHSFESETPKADRRAVHADPELLDYWRTLPAPSNERLAVEIIETLQRELQQWTRWGIVEISVRNPSVADYCAHWEGRTETAERRLSLAQTEIKGHMRVAKEVRVDALEEAAKVCDAYKEELLNEARAAPDGFAIVGYRQITAEYLAAAIRSLKSRA